ncbi:hypothetical protein BC332_01458 [Capsicum chinense]|nr:hypothetical protein BC332_01458 [Capsicum chinense]
MTHPGGTKFLLHGAGIYYTAEQKNDGKASESLQQIERFNKVYDCVPVCSDLNYVNGLFCVWEPLSVRPAAIFNPGTREFVISDYESAIAAFDVKSEKFEIMAFWNAIESVYYYKLIEVKGN